MSIENSTQNPFFPQGYDPSNSGFKNQFGHPQGLLGWLVGWILAVGKKRSLWVLSLLSIKPNDQLLEIGFGPGLDIQRVSEQAIGGFVAGIDYSSLMVIQAKKRNAAGIREGKIELKQASIAQRLSYSDETFTKIYSINSFQFWPDPVEGLKEVRRVLKPGGLVAIAVQPLIKGANEETVRQTGRWLVNCLEVAGFSQVRVETQPMKPVGVACALGNRL